MRTRLDPRPLIRGGFTLVELLVVISLIAILLALSAGAFFRIQSSQNVFNAEKTLEKLHSLMDSKWKITLDDARKTVPADATFLTSLGGDKERAQIVWTYAKLKNEMPMTFAELLGPSGTVAAPQPITLQLVPTPIQLYPRKVYLNVITAASAGASLELQSAALFYTMVSQTASGGTMNSAEGTSYQTTTDSATGLTHFVDAWGKPVAFVRHALNGEINSTPFAHPAKAKGYPTGPLINSSLDNGGKLTFDMKNTWYFPAYPAPSINLNTAQNLRGSLNVGLPTAYEVKFDNVNQLPTLVSAGANNDFGANWLDPSDDDAADNLLSYRLRSVGAKGN